MASVSLLGAPAPEKAPSRPLSGGKAGGRAGRNDGALNRFVLQLIKNFDNVQVRREGKEVIVSLYGLNDEEFAINASFSEIDVVFKNKPYIDFSKRMIVVGKPRNMGKINTYNLKKYEFVTLRYLNNASLEFVFSEVSEA